jgi:hypothetical protein
VAQGVEHLHGKPKAQSSNPVLKKKTKKDKYTLKDGQRGWWSGSSSRVSALQAQSPEFKPQY